MNNLKQSRKIVLFLLLFVSVVILCRPLYAESIWEKRKSRVQDIVNPKEAAKPTKAIDETLQTQDIDVIDPSEIFIPEQYGTIIETHRGTNGKLIVHVQDAHANYEGQMNSANIVESLIENYTLNLILREGGYTSSDFSYLRDWASPEARKRAAENLLRDATITGVEYLDISSDYPMSFQGIEDKALYEANKEALWKIDEFKEPASEYIARLIVASDEMKPYIYSNPLLELDNKKKDYDNEQIDLIDYYAYLYEKAEEQGIPLYVFPNFSSLIEANDLEKRIDMLKVQEGSAEEEEMDLYAKYIELTRELNINELFKEEPLLEDAVQDAFAENSDQKKLLRVSKALAIMKNLLRIKVVPEEYEYFLDNKKDFNPLFWTDFITGKSPELGLSIDMPSDSSIISDNLIKIEKFYGIAEERNIAFVKKVEAATKKDNIKIAALIAGGFHTPRLTQLLDEKGFSYVVISPKVTTETDEDLYRSILRR